jgi:hypothetical protein
MLTNVFILAVRIGPVEADETFIFQDDFENYNVGDFPSTGGWELVFNGQGDQYQIVTDTMSFSGSKSFQLWGYPNWAAVAQKKFDATSPVIGYEFAILIDAVGSGGPGRDEHPGFFNREAYIWGKYYATVRFNHDDMKIYAEDGTFLGQWSPREWYHIKVILDKSINKYNVWINGELRGENLSTTNQDTELINALALNSDHPGVKVYYDDVKIMVQGSINNDIAPLPAKALAPDGSLIDRALLISVSTGQTVVVSPGQTVSLTVGYQIWQGSNPNEIDQMFFLYSWSPTWPPPSGYYAEIYNSIPPGYPGETGTRQVDITVPTTEGAYYLWVGWGAHYSVPQAVQAFTQQPSLPAHVKIVVQTTAEYSLSVSFAEAYMNGETLTSPDSTIYLNPGESIQGYLKVYVNNNRGGPWITPVIGTVSWGRQVSGSVEGWFTAISYDAPTGTSLQTFSFNLNAPSSPGTYYIGVFTGWMYTADEVASGDHPANYGDGDDVWDMRQSDWEAVTSYGQAPEGAVYRMPGRAIRIIVQGTVSLGPPGTYVQIFWKRDNNYNFDIDLNVTDAPESVGSGQAIFWAHFFSFVGGNRGYIGLQIVGSQKKAIFSIWDAITGEPGNPFEEQGHGWQIIIDYDWKLNHKYRLRIWELNVEQNGDEWWLATVYDYSVGVDTVIGKILVPASWGWLDATSLTWVEYAGYDNCESQNIPYSRAEFSNLFARNTAGDSGPIKLKVYYGSKPAKNSDVDYYGGGTYALEAGDDVFRDTPEIWLTDLHVQLCMHVCSIPNNAFFITRYDSPIPCRSTESYLAVPANLQTTIMVRGSLYYGGSNPEKQNLISGKEVRLFIDGELVSTFVTNENSPNLEGVVNITLPEGLHDCEIRSEGDETFSSSFESFKIIAYKSSEFYMGRDSFQFENWEYTFEEHQMLLGKLLEEGMIDQSIKYPLVAIFPILSAPGHCFGMAAASSVYNINPNLKPKAVSTYELLKEDAIWDIEFYQILVIVQTLHGNALSSQLNDIKRCIDSGTPILLSYSIPEFTHTITVIGYYQEKDETFLVCYDNRSPDSIYLYSVVDGKLLYIWENKHINITNVALTDPRSIPAPISSVDLTSALKELFEAYLGISIHSPVNIKIMDENGNEFVTENNTIVRNDISDAYFYISEEAKIVLLPSNRTYSISIIGTDFGQVDIDLTSVVGNDIFTYQFHNIPINYGDKIYVNSTQPEIAYFDSSGDGTIDKEIYAEVVPEFPSIVISTSLILTGLIIIVLLKKRRKIQP